MSVKSKPQAQKFLAWILGAVLVVFTLPLAHVPGSDVLAATEKKKIQRRTRKTPAMRERIYKKLAAAQKDAEAEHYDDALEKLDALSNKKLNSYETAQLWNYYAFIRYSKNDYAGAIEAYENILKQENLPIAMESGSRFSLSQLYFAQERYADSLRLLKTWFETTETPSASAYMMLAQVYYSLKRYKDALVPTRQAIHLYEQKGKLAKEQWWMLLRVLYYELGDYPKVADVLEYLVKHYPQKKDYWLQLAGVYSQLDRPHKQAITMDLAYQQGMLTKSSEIINLVQLLLQEDIAYRAATILDKAMQDKIVKRDRRSLRLLSQAYQMSAEDEAALGPLKAAAKLSKDGGLYMQLAYSYSNLRRWADAAKSAQAALDAGGLKRPGDADVIMGTAYFNLEKYTKAEKAFRAATKLKRTARMARQWIAYIHKERQRKKELALAMQ